MNVGNPFSAIPEEMRLLPNWCMWKLEYPNGIDKKPTKVPYQPNGRHTSTTDPSTWITFDAAFNALQMGGFDGVGFIFTNTEYTGIDLDDCSFLKDGSANPHQQIDIDRQIKLYQELDSYSERSPSGKGCHIIVKGKTPDGRKRSFIELYPSGRFFTMTGDVCNNKPIAHKQDVLDILWKQMGGEVNNYSSIVESAETISDTDLINLASAAVNGEKFKALNAGDISAFATRSEADIAYVNIIAFYTNNKTQVARIYDNSILGNFDKKRKRKDYINNMVNKSFDQKIPLVNIDGLKEALLNKVEQSTTIATTTKAVIPLPPGLLGDIARFIYAAAPRPVPEIALAGAIGLMAGITGRAYNISGTGLNQYVLLLAKTGRGKESIASGVDKLMNHVKMQVPTSSRFRGPGIINSGQALTKYLNTTSNCFVSILGEFGITIERVSDPHANSADKMLYQCLLDLYNKSGHGQTYQPSIYSDKANNVGITESPAVTILGESTPKIFYNALNEDMISAGLLPRFLIIEYDGYRVDLNEGHLTATPDWELQERFAALIAQCETVMHGNRVINVQSDEQSTLMLRAFDKKATHNINTASEDVIAELWNRAHMKVLRLSAMIAVGVNMIEPIIIPEYVTWAMDLIQNDIKSFSVKFEKGEIGKDSFESKQSADMIKAIVEYSEKDYNYVKKYDGVASLHKDKVISHGYLNSRLRNVASFRKDKQGPTPAIKRTVLNLIDNGKLIDLTSAQMLDRYKTAIKSYSISPTIKSD